MWTMSETDVTTTIMVAVRLSMRKPISILRLPTVAQV